MKNLMKKVSLAVSLSLCVTLAVPVVGTAKIFAAPVAGFNSTVSQITINQFDTDGIKGQAYNISEGYYGSDKATVKVFTPYGDDITSSVTAGVFTPEYAGNYKIVYEHPTNSDISTEMTVAVSGIAKGLEIKIQDNDALIIPSIVKPAGSTIEIEMPQATVFDKDGNEVSGAEVSIVPTFSPKSGSAANVVCEYTGGKLKLDGDAEGTYTVTYKYVKNSATLATKAFKIEANKNFDTDFELGFDYSSSKPTSAEIGQETKLPSVTGINKGTKDQVNVHYEVTAKVTVGETTTNYTASDVNNDVLEFVDGRFVFTPVIDGDYVVTYKVKDFYGHEVQNSFEIEDVKDTKSSTPVAVLPYTLNNGTVDYTEASEAIKSNTKAENIILMPIFADDNANGIVENNLELYRVIKNASNSVIFNEKTDIVDQDSKRIDVTNKVLVFKSTLDLSNLADTDVALRVMVNGEVVSILKNQIYVVSDDTVNNKLTSGQFTATYTSNDKAKNGLNSKNYDFKISSTFEDTIAPVVEFAENLQSAMFIDDKITFEKPTATDYDTSNDPNSKTIVDKRLSVRVAFEVEVGGTYLSETESAAYGELAFDKDKNEYTFSLKDTATTVTSVKIIAYANDDGDANDESWNIGSKEQIIKVLNTGDTAATTVVGTPAIDNAQDFTQGNDIVLPTVVYSDDLINYVDVNITITNGDKHLYARDVVIDRDLSLNQITVRDAVFTATLSGDYKIVYQTIDAKNNVTITIFELTVNPDLDSLNPQFTGLGAELVADSIEIGEKVSLPVPSINLNTSEYSFDYQVKVISGPANYSLTENSFFTPAQAGTYVLQYVGTVTEISSGTTLPQPLESKEFTIEVLADSVAPEFEDFQAIRDYFEAQKDQHKTDYNTLEKNTTFNLPRPQTLASDIDWAKSSVSVKASTTDVYYLDDWSKLDNYRFDENYSYTITYTLVDIYGNSTSEAITFDVGDVLAPEVTLADDFVSDKYKIGDELTIDLSKITIEDLLDENILVATTSGGETTYSVVSGAELKVTLTNTSTGSTVANKLTSSNSNLQFAFDIEEAGEYNVVVSVTDTSGKTTTNKDFSFTVASAENEGATAEEVLGVVLIIVSVLLLGGVITYFVVTRKNFDKKYK